MELGILIHIHVFTRLFVTVVVERNALLGGRNTINWPEIKEVCVK